MHQRQNQKNNKMGKSNFEEIIQENIFNLNAN